MGLFRWLLGRSAPPLVAEDRTRETWAVPPVPKSDPPPIKITLTHADDWTPPPPETVLQIIAPVLPGRKRTHDLRQHQCLLEYENANGRLLRRHVVLLDARNVTYSVLVRAYTVGEPKSHVAEYRVHRMKSITGPDGRRMAPIEYLSAMFGLLIK